MSKALKTNNLMKETDTYTETLICLRSILQADHPEFQNWINWLNRDIEDWTKRREVAHHLRAYGGMGSFNDLPNMRETTTTSSVFSSQCAMPSAISMARGKAFLRRH